jgi:hypothetical protein
MCTHPNKYAIMSGIKTNIESKNSRSEISAYVKSLSNSHLELIASDLNISSGMPRVLLTNSIVNHYVCQLSIRNRRIRRYELDIEENDTGTFTPPHSLFRRCIEVVSSVSSNMFRLLTGRMNNYNHYVRIERTPNDRKWQIIPEYKFANNKSKMECPICMEHRRASDIIYLRCEHELCHSCFINYIGKCGKKVPLCPICREQITSISVCDLEHFNSFVKKFVDDE